jgi:hypothetical protein
MVQSEFDSSSCEALRMVRSCHDVALFGVLGMVPS